MIQKNDNNIDNIYSGEIPIAYLEIEYQSIK